MQRLDAARVRLDAANGRLGPLSNRLDSLRSRFDAVNVWFDAARVRFDALWLSAGRVLPVALFVLSVLVQLCTITRPASIYDEGLTLVGAQRILLGEVPYRDFWNTHAPGQIAVVAALFRVFGQSIIVERAYEVLLRASLAVVVFLLARRMGTRVWALGAWAAVTMLLADFPYFGYVTFPALLAALAGLLLLLRVKHGPSTSGAARRLGLALAGAGAGCSMLFRHDLGLESALAGLVVIWLDVAGRRDVAARPMQRLRERLGETLAYLCGVGALVLPVALAFLWLGTPWHRLREIFVTYPFLVYPHFRGLPLPSTLLARLWIAVPAAVVLAGLVRGSLAARRNDGDEGRLAALLPLALTALLAFPQAYTRPNLAQQTPVILLAFAILPGLLVPCVWSGRWRRALKVTCGAGAVILALLMLKAPLAGAVGIARTVHAHDATAAAHGLKPARFVPLEQAQVEAVKAVQAMTREDNAIYVGLGRHDRTFVNDVLLYFLAGRRPATYYHNLLPGLVTAAPVQREILADLERRPARLVVLYSGFDAEEEPNRSRLSSGVELLDEGIRRDYERARVIGPYEIWVRKPGHGPAQARAGEIGYDSAKPAQARSGEIGYDSARPGQARSGEIGYDPAP